MHFQVQLARAHSTEQATVPTGSNEPAGPLLQFGLVNFEAPQDHVAFGLHPNQMMHLIQSLPVSQDPTLPTEGWGPWQATVLRDLYLFAMPAIEQGTREGSKLADVVLKHLNSTPERFGFDAWTTARALVDLFVTEGTEYTWSPEGTLVRTASEEELAAERECRSQPGFAVKTLDQRVQETWAAGPLLQPAVKLPAVSQRARIFHLPDHIEDSHLLGAYELLVYLLGRPVWENTAIQPQDWAGIWNNERPWQLATLVDGAKQRTLLELAYQRILTGPLGARLQELLGEQPVAKEFMKDVSVPPRARLV